MGLFVAAFRMFAAKAARVAWSALLEIRGVPV